MDELEMNRDDIIRMAREAQMPFYWATGEIPYLGRLERFAALVAAAEREACAKVCDEPSYMQQRAKTSAECAAAIRERSANAIARGEK